MEVNRELPNLAAGLDESVHLVGPGGRVLVLAYHSLEDRIVKERFTRLGRCATAAPAGPARRAAGAARLVPPASPVAGARARGPDGSRAEPAGESARLPGCREAPPP